MITNGFTYIAVLVFIAAMLVWLQRYTKSKFFDYAPPIVLLYLVTMILCTLGAWDMEATKPAYSVLKNNLLYAMIFLMLLRCDIRKIIKLGPKMLGGFFAASVSISLATSSFRSPVLMESSWFLMLTRAPGSIDEVINALLPMTAPLPMTVSPPSIEAPA